MRERDHGSVADHLLEPLQKQGRCRYCAIVATSHSATSTGIAGRDDSAAIGSASRAGNLHFRTALILGQPHSVFGHEQEQSNRFGALLGDYFCRWRSEFYVVFLFKINEIINVIVGGGDRRGDYCDAGWPFRCCLAEGVTLRAIIPTVKNLQA